MIALRSADERLTWYRQVALIATLTGLIALGAASDGRADVTRTAKKNLDGDARREAVQLLTGTRLNPYGGTAPLPMAHIRVLDRRNGHLLKRRISPQRVERARFRIRDLNRDDRPEIWFNGLQGMGFFSFGLYAWTGANQRILWRWDNARSWSGAGVLERELSSRMSTIHTAARRLSWSKVSCGQGKHAAAQVAY